MRSLAFSNHKPVAYELATNQYHFGLRTNKVFIPEPVEPVEPVEVEPVEPPEFVPEPVLNLPNVLCNPRLFAPSVLLLMACNTDSELKYRVLKHNLERLEIPVVLINSHKKYDFGVKTMVFEGSDYQKWAHALKNMKIKTDYAVFTNDSYFLTANVHLFFKSIQTDFFAWHDHGTGLYSDYFFAVKATKLVHFVKYIDSNSEITLQKDLPFDYFSNHDSLLRLGNLPNVKGKNIYDTPTATLLTEHDLLPFIPMDRFEDKFSF